MAVVFVPIFCIVIKRCSGFVPTHPASRAMISPYNIPPVQLSNQRTIYERY